MHVSLSFSWATFKNTAQFVGHSLYSLLVASCARSPGPAGSDTFAPLSSLASFSSVSRLCSPQESPLVQNRVGGRLMLHLLERLVSLLFGLLGFAF